MIPSVTQVLAILPRPDFEGIPDEVMERAADRGSRVHRICAGLLKGTWVPASALHDPEYAPYVQSFRLWRPVIEEVHLVEPELVHDQFGFKGHPDFVGRLKGDTKATIADWKTPAAANRKVWALQLAAYRPLVEKAAGIEVGRVMCVRLRADGGAPIIDEFDDRESAEALSVFLSALNCWRYLNKD